MQQAQPLQNRRSAASCRQTQPLPGRDEAWWMGCAWAQFPTLLTPSTGYPSAETWLYAMLLLKKVWELLRMSIKYLPGFLKTFLSQGWNCLLHRTLAWMNHKGDGRRVTFRYHRTCQLSNLSVINRWIWGNYFQKDFSLYSTAQPNYGE